MSFRGRKQPFSAYGEKPLAAAEHGVGGLRDPNWSWLSKQGRLPKSELLPQRLGRGPGEEMGSIGAGTPLFVAPPTSALRRTQDSTKLRAPIPGAAPRTRGHSSCSAPWLQRNQASYYHQAKLQPDSSPAWGMQKCWGSRELKQWVLIGCLGKAFQPQDFIEREADKLWGGGAFLLTPSPG